VSSFSGNGTLKEGWAFGDAFPLEVLSAMLRYPGFLRDTASLLRKHFFVKADLVVLADLVLRYWQQYEVIPQRAHVEALVWGYIRKYDPTDTQGLSERLLGWLERIYAYSIVNVDFVRGKVTDFARRRAMVEAVSRMVSEIERSPEEVDTRKIASYWESAAQVGLSQDLGNRFQKVALHLPQILREDRAYGAKYKVPTGFQTLDRSLQGGTGAGELLVVAAPPNRGKTTILAAMGARAASYFSTLSENPQAVIHVTCEMKQPDILLKYAAAFSGIEMDRIVKGDQEYYRAIDGIDKRSSPVYIKYFSPGTVSVEELRWFVSSLVSQEAIRTGVVILDYADRLSGMEDDRFRGMGKIYDGLIGLGDRLVCPVWTGSQVNRAHYKDTLVDGDGLSESWKKFEAADVVLTVSPQTGEEYENGHLRVFFPKVRRGKARQTVFCQWQPERCLIREYSTEEVNRLGLLVPKKRGGARSGGDGGGDEFALFRKMVPLQPEEVPSPPSFPSVVGPGSGSSSS
jgi:replicative DNA helicase